MPDYQILHQPEQNLFYIPLDDGQRAFVKYRHSGDRTTSAGVDFWSTFVPENYRSQGLASKMVEHAFQWAEQNNLHIKTSCWYAARVLERRDR